MRTLMTLALATTAALVMGSGVKADEPPLPRMSYYPYSYFPHSYWPAQSPKYPETKGQPYVKPPAPCVPLNDVKAS